MAPRSQALQAFLDATREALSVRVKPGTPEASAMQRVTAALDLSVGDQAPLKSLSQPACAHLEAAIVSAERGPADVARVAHTFKALLPSLHWKLKSIADPAFAVGHRQYQSARALSRSS